MTRSSRKPRPGDFYGRTGRAHVLLALGIVLVLAGVAAWWARTARPGGLVVAPLRPVTTTIVPGISMLANLGPSVVYVIETSEGLVLVDSGMDAEAAALRREMARLNLDPQRVCAVLLTHAHGDHSGGAQHFHSAGAKVYAGHSDADVLRAGAPRVAFFSVFTFQNQSLHPTDVDVALDGGETLRFGAARIQALAAPGHTPGSVCYLLERDGQRVLFTGDVVSSLHGEPTNHSDACNPLGTYSAYLAPRYRGDAAAYRDTLRRLRALPVPDLVLPGHPASDPVPQSPRLTQERWEEMLDQGIREMTALAARYKADGADFLDDRPKELLPGLAYLGDFQGKSVYSLDLPDRSVLVTSTAATGLGDFVQKGRQQIGLKPAKPALVLLTRSLGGELAGVAELGKAGDAEIVVPRESLSQARAALATGAKVSASESLAKLGAIEVTTIPLLGRGEPSVAYALPWAGKTILFTDRTPVLFDREASDALTRDLARSRNDVLDYMLSVERLADLKPDLWLPAEPTEGQNANLYESEWRRITDTNLLAGFDRLGKQP